MKRGLIMAVLVAAIFIACFSVSRGETLTEEPAEEVKISSAKPVMVPYLNIDINEVSSIRKEKQNATNRLDKRVLQRIAETQQITGNSERNPDESSNSFGGEQQDDYCNDGSTEQECNSDCVGDDNANAGSGGINENEEANSESEYQDVYEEASEPETYDEDEVYVSDGESSGCDSEDQGDAAEVYQYIGDWTITAYCPCAACCGQWATGYTASGTFATAGRTVACNSLPFGTRLLIDGQEYVVEDTGWSPYGDAWIDIFFNTHDEALAYGEKVEDVYLIVSTGE